MVIAVAVFIVLEMFGFARANSAFGQEPFYRGKTIRLIVGTDPGGGFDTYSRAIARHITRYIPGSPTIVVENMPGAAHMISANYIYKDRKTRWSYHRKLHRCIITRSDARTPRDRI